MYLYCRDVDSTQRLHKIIHRTIGFVVMRRCDS